MVKVGNCTPYWCATPIAAVHFAGFAPKRVAKQGSSQRRRVACAFCAADGQRFAALQ
jgi:hypothetical protein